MNLVQLKEKANISTFHFNPATDKAGVKDEKWLRHWDNENRVSVSIHVDTLAKIKANMEIDNLALQSETREGKQGGYTALRIVAYNEAEETL